MRQGSSLLLSLLVVAAAASVCAGLVDFPVARLFQLDAHRAGDAAPEKLGARRSAVDGTAVSYAAAKARVAASSGNSSSRTTMLRQVVVVDAQTLAAGEDVFATLRAAAERGAAGAVLVVPRDGAVPAGAAAAWRALEARLLAEALPESCAVYVALREDVPARVLAAGGAVSLAVRAKPLVAMNGPKQRTPLALANVVATLSGARAEAGTDALPTVAVVANYDTFGVAPALAVGAAESAAPAAVLLELHRVFAALYAAPATRPDYNMQFVLTSGAALNYAGLRAWAAQQDPAPDFVLCLDSLLASPAAESESSNKDNSENNEEEEDTYYLHVSKPGSKDAAVQAAYDAVVAGARAAGARVAVRQKKVNVARDEFAWPHEALAVKRVLAATLTRARAPAAAHLLARASLLDRTAPDASTLARATRTAAEALARIVYADTFRALDASSSSEAEEAPKFFFQGPLAINGTHVAAWAAGLAARGRCMPAASQVGSALVQALQGALAPATVQAWPLPGAQGQQQQQQRGGLVVDDDGDDDEVATAPARAHYTFYSWPPRAGADVRCIVHARTPALWDLFMLVFTAGFLAALYAAVHRARSTRAKRD